MDAAMKRERHTYGTLVAVLFVLALVFLCRAKMNGYDKELYNTSNATVTEATQSWIADTTWKGGWE